MPARLDSRLARLGQNVRTIRQLRELSQGELAHLVGVTRSSIANLESGRQNIAVVTLFELATVLETSIGVLVDEQVMQWPPPEAE